MREKIDALVARVRKEAAHARGLVVPVSGGTDSALAFWICSRALPGKVGAVHAGRSLVAKTWFESVGPVTYVETPGEHAEREEMRWARFQATALARGHWLVGCRNRTEDLLGTYSLMSRVATFLPLVGVWKSEVLAMCRELAVPNYVIAASLAADPDCGRPRELAEIAYADIERFLRVRAGEAPDSDLASLSESQVRYLDDVSARNAFKHALPIRVGGVKR